MTDFVEGFQEVHLVCLGTLLLHAGDFCDKLLQLSLAVSLAAEAVLEFVVKIIHNNAASDDRFKTITRETCKWFVVTSIIFVFPFLYVKWYIIRYPPVHRGDTFS